jgi:DNA mismatch endonuclease (patch repair protein)
MKRIKSKWTKQEKFMHEILKSNDIRHTMHPKIFESPDIIIKDKKIAIFIDGCFWHGCRKHYIAPKTNINYWRKKINGNIKRDKRNTEILKKKGWKVIRIWEHEIKDKKMPSVLKRIR